MKWHQMTSTQQNAARRLSSLLYDKEDVFVTVSQVAKYFDQVMAWSRGEITIDQLKDALER